jgi:hypothetical protein
MTTTLPPSNGASRATTFRCNKSWTDPNTKRHVRQLTDLPQGAGLAYFRLGRHLHDGRLLAYANGDQGNVLLIDPASGDVEHLPINLNLWGGKFYESSATYYEFTQAGQPSKSGRAPVNITRRTMPYGQPEHVATLPSDAPGDPHDISCDGKTLILVEYQQDNTDFPIPTTMDLKPFWGWFSRPRRSAIWAWDIASSTARKIYETQGFSVLHIECSLTDPTLVRFAHDMYDAYTQRCWTIRTNATSLTRIHPQRFGDLITHEFWWPDASMIGYTYQDRTKSTTLQTHAWAEYSPEPTQFGLADSCTGKNLYLSDPVNCYHTHIFRSPCGKYISGEGTHDHSMVYSAHFDIKNPRLTMIPLATVRTPYVPFRGQHVETGYSPDSKWLLYNEQIDGKHQVMCVKNDI